MISTSCHERYIGIRGAGLSVMGAGQYFEKNGGIRLFDLLWAVLPMRRVASADFPGVSY